MDAITDTAMAMMHSALDAFRVDIDAWLTENAGDWEILCLTLQALRTERGRLTEIITMVERATEG